MFQDVPTQVAATLVDRATEVLGYTFRESQHLHVALTHASIAGSRLQSNERMEFLGDAILDFVVCDYLFEKFPDLMEGELTKIKSNVVSRRVCAQISQAIDLGSMLSLGKGMSSRAALPASVAAAVLEAIIAAIYLDGGIEPARAFILKHVTPLIDEAAASSHQHNFKSVLQQYTQKHLPDNPVYLLLDEKGPDHSKQFEVCVQIKDHQYASAWGSSKKEAEQQAALLALREMNLVAIDKTGRVVLREPLPA